MSTQKITLQNNRLNMSVCYGSDFVIEQFANTGFDSQQTLNVHPFELQFMDKTFLPADFEISLLCNTQDNTQQLVSFLFTNDQYKIKLRLHLINDLDATITVLYQVWDDYKYGVPYEMFFHSPLLEKLSCGQDEQITYLPANICTSKDGKRLVRPVGTKLGNHDANPPYVTCEKNNKYGFSVLFPCLSDLNDDGASQDRNMDFNFFTSIDQIKGHQVRLNPDASFNDAVEFAITGLVDGWKEAFARFREQWATNYDFSQYQRPDLKWLEDTLIHNFCFFYGDEAFDHQTGKIDTQRLLKAGLEFGGYDTVTFWNQYPRLGLDSRDQWDFHDQLPFGRADEKRAVDELHANGVKVFMPYIPWDQSEYKSTDVTGDEFAKLLADTGADGYQLDTLITLPYSFRKKTDLVRDGLILQTQHHPEKKHYIEFITSSWDEFWDVRPMPEMDLLRYLLPQHVSPVISRWLRKEDKDMIINRAMFSATGLVIWQDIFGRWMPFSPEQKQRIKDYKKVYFAHRDLYLCKAPTPLYHTYQKDIYCNVFENEKGCIYSFYNDTQTPFAGNICAAINANAKHSVVLGDGTATLSGQDLQVCIKPKSVLHVLAQ